MKTFRNAAGEWLYVFGSENSAKAIVTPSGKAYALPSGFSVTFKKPVQALSLNYGKTVAGRITAKASITFYTEADLEFAVNYFYSVDGFTETKLEPYGDCIPYRKPWKRHRIVTEDVLIPVDRYRKPFPTLSDLKLYFRNNHPTKAWPMWVNDPKAEDLARYDPALTLADDEAIACFIAEAFETGDAVCIANALGEVVRLKGMTEITKKTGLSRELLYRSFIERGNPTLKNTLAVMRALGVEITTKFYVAT